MSAGIFAAPVSGAHARFMTNLPAKRVPGAMDSVPWRQKTVSRGSKIRCMKTWNPIDNKKFETFSYLPPLSNESLTKQVGYMLEKGWIPCIEFDERGIVHRSNGQMPGYYDGRYFTMWKLPMFGCTEASQVMHEIDECREAFPNAYVRLIAFDNKRQAQCMGFIIHKPNYLENKT